MKTRKCDTQLVKVLRRLPAAYLADLPARWEEIVENLPKRREGAFDYRVPLHAANHPEWAGARVAPLLGILTGGELRKLEDAIVDALIRDVFAKVRDADGFALRIKVVSRPDEDYLRLAA